jgi:hypothetical protein
MERARTGTAPQKLWLQHRIMTRCPNCGRLVNKTPDYACRWWCRYPITAESDSLALFYLAAIAGRGTHGCPGELLLGLVAHSLLAVILW